MEFEKKDTVYIPTLIKEIIYYTPDEYKLFISDVCDISGLPSLKKVIVNFQQDDLLIRGYIQAVSDGKSYYEGVSLEVVTSNQKNYHKELYKLMYEVPLKDLPLYINVEEDYIQVIKWRFKVGK